MLTRCGAWCCGANSFGHVEFEEEDAVDKAVALAGTDVAGRPIRVDFAGGKERDSATGGRGGARY